MAIFISNCPYHTIDFDKLYLSFVNDERCMVLQIIIQAVQLKNTTDQVSLLLVNKAVLQSLSWDEC